MGPGREKEETGKETEEVEEVVEEAETETEAKTVSSNNHEAHEGCMKLSNLFVLCEGHVYSVVVGRRTIVGILERVERRYLKALLRTEKGLVMIDLRKVSVIEELK